MITMRGKKCAEYTATSRCKMTSKYCKMTGDMKTDHKVTEIQKKRCEMSAKSKNKEDNRPQRCINNHKENQNYSSKGGPGEGAQRHRDTERPPKK